MDTTEVQPCSECGMSDNRHLNSCATKGVGSKRPYPEDDLVNASVHEVAREIDRILNRQSVQDHAAVLGIIQCTGARRAQEHQDRNAKQMQEAQKELQRRQAQQQFAVQ